MIRLSLPYTDGDELDEIRKVLASGYIAQGKKVAEFEELVAKYVGTRFAFATSSATTALHLCLSALSIGPGDEVLVPDFTFPATANVVIQQGARPVLVDVSLATYNINVEDLERKITERSKAIIPVHLFGLPAEMGPILELAGKHDLHVIEDAACALGGQYEEKQCGGLGDLGCFSFHARKVITTGEGGMITTDDEEIAERIGRLRNHGGVREEGRFTFEDAGFNYRMSDINGAVGVAQMRKLDGLLDKRRRNAELLRRRLVPLSEDLKLVYLPQEPSASVHTYQSFVLQLAGPIDRDSLIAQLGQRGLEATIGTYALHCQPFFQRTFGLVPGELPNSYQAYTHSLAVPFYPQMSEDDIEFVAQSLLEILVPVPCGFGKV